MAKTLEDDLFNIDLLVLQPNQIKLMKEVTNLAVFESNTQVFSKDGLFSTEIFGPVGSTLRLEKAGYIDLKLPVLHPLVYKYLKTLDKQYDEIMKGKLTVTFNKELGIYEEDPNGQTGFEYFMSNLQDLKFVSNDSKQRENKISLVDYGRKPEKWLQYFVVIPAGLRDYVIDKSGRPSQDEVNDIYRRIITSINTIRNSRVTPSTYSNYDMFRYKIQNLVLDVFTYLYNILEGKRGFVQSKWASRSVEFSTRNVITANTTVVKDIKTTRNTNNETIIGLYQYSKGITPLAMHHIHKNFVQGVVNPINNNAKVIDKKTLRTTLKVVKTKDKEVWLSREGLNNMLNKFKQDVIKSDYATIGEDYIALVVEKGNHVYIIKDTNNVPEGINLDRDKPRPITYAEIIYISIVDTTNYVRGTITRYPVQNIGSVHPVTVYLKTTEPARKVILHMDGIEKELPEYPIDGNEYLGSLVVPTTALKRLGADLMEISSRSAYKLF